MKHKNSIRSIVRNIGIKSVVASALVFLLTISVREYDNYLVVLKHGVLAYDVKLAEIQEISERIASHTPGSYGIVLDKTGTVIAHSNKSELGKNYLEEKDTIGAKLADDVLKDDKHQFEFKSVNDKFGHDVGDKVIIWLADSLSKAMRNNDIVMRLGGDEFVAFAPGVVTDSEALPIINRIFDNISNMEIHELGDHKVYVSLGAAFCPKGQVMRFYMMNRSDSI